MIYTLTSNPSLDYILNVDELQLGKTNRSSNEYLFAGGKGINVSIVLHNCNQQTCTLGFVSGFTGKEIIRQIKDMNILNDFIELDGEPSRINVKIHGINETEINAKGPILSTLKLERLYDKLDKLQQNDILVLAGSAAQGCDDYFYENIMKRLEDKNIPIVVDATKDLLLNTLKHKPLLIKPNKDELSDLLDIKIETLEDVEKGALELQNLGARNVLISLGKDGAYLLSEDGTTYHSRPPRGKLINSVGSGDSMVAGFLYGYLKHNDYKEAFLYGLCSGSASAFSSKLASLDEIERLIPTIREDVKEGKI